MPPVVLANQVVEQALQAGMQVTAVVRNPDGLAVRHRLLTIVKGDVLIPATFQHEITGKDAVISCLGVPKIQPTTLYSEGMHNIVKARQQSGVKRIIGISSGAISIPPNSSWIMSFLLKNVLQRFYKPHLHGYVPHGSHSGWFEFELDDCTGTQAYRWKKIKNLPSHYRLTFTRRS